MTKYNRYESAVYRDIFDLKGDVLIGRLYIDDSKDHKQQSVFILAGFHSPVKKWEKFDKAWSRALSKGPISIEYFKSTEAASMRGQFARSRGWSRQLIDDKINGLTKIIKKYCETCFYVHVDPKDFKEHVGSQALFGGNTLFDKEPYHFLVFMLIQRFYEYMKYKNQKSRQHMIFDNQLGYEPLVAYLWDLMKRWVTFNGTPFTDCAFVGNAPAHGDDKDYTPLQAADLMAWAIRRRYEGLRLDNKVPQESLDRLGSIPWVPFSASANSMASINEIMQNDPNYLDTINAMTDSFKIRNMPTSL